MFWFLIIAVIVAGVIGGVYSVKKDNAEAKEIADFAKAKGFEVTKEIGLLKIDEKNKKWMVSTSSKIYNFSDIASVEISQNGESYKSKGGVFRSVVGGATFGIVGAVVGATTAKQLQSVSSLSVLVHLNSISDSLVKINYITTPTKTDSFIFKNSFDYAQRTASTLQAMQNQSLNNPC